LIKLKNSQDSIFIRRSSHVKKNWHRHQIAFLASFSSALLDSRPNRTRCSGTHPQFPGRSVCRYIRAVYQVHLWMCGLLKRQYQEILSFVRPD